VLSLDRSNSAQLDNFLDTSCGVVPDGSDRAVDSELTLGNIHTNDDGIVLVEDLDRLEDTREDSKHLGFLLLLLELFIHVLGEGIEQMVNDIGCENLDALILSVLLSFLVDLDIETQHDSIVWRLLQHDTTLHDITLVDGSDTNVGNGNLAVLEEIKQSLE
jgi:hypothetical protein